MRCILVVIFLTIPQILMACPTAADLASNGSNPGLALETCYELGRFDISTGDGNVTVTIFGTRRSDEQYILGILEGLSFAGDSLANLGPLTTEPIEVFISPSAYVPFETEGNAMATASPSETNGPGNPEACVIVTFPVLQNKFYNWVLAHEFFHCVQFAEFQLQQESSGSDWWVESSAVWFADFTYPQSTISNRYVSQFDVQSQNRPITQITYPNVVFMDWYTSQYGESAIVGLMASMSKIGAHDDALAAIISDEQFMQFARSYLDKNIYRPGNRRIPSVPIFEDIHRWDEDEVKHFEAERFRIYRAYLEFSCSEWRLEERDRVGLTTVSKVPDGFWEDVPVEIKSEDGEDIRYQFIAVATGPDGFSAKIEAKKEPCSICVHTIEDDSPEACLVGEWHLVSGGMGEFLSTRLEGISGMQNVDYPELDGILEFDPDGSFRATTDDTGSLEVRIPKSDDLLLSQDKFNFVKTGTWSVNGDRLLQCNLPPSIQINTETFDTSNETTTRINIEGFRGPRNEYNTSRRFGCDENTLTIREGGFLSPKITWVYQH